MTKEELNDEINQYSVSDFTKQSLKELFKMFTDSNVCIPIGENRHPYADILHEWVEGADVEGRPTMGEWMQLCDSITLHQDEYRIKPSEPVWEYQWCVTMQDGEGSIYGYHTEEGINEIFPTFSKIKIGSTKRERQ